MPTAETFGRLAPPGRKRGQQLRDPEPHRTRTAAERWRLVLGEGRPLIFDGTDARAVVAGEL
jgi:hypothetical protein